jgi:hypothetical protein
VKEKASSHEHCKQKKKKKFEIVQKEENINFFAYSSVISVKRKQQKMLIIASFAAFALTQKAQLATK